ncbi:hypothetical protein BU17DRAFT_70377 [Hysterangium stoloniferum]|nr:hypothetical protein BU17DRAFT_70377 [Hysterangium stoloniferum]
MSITSVQLREQNGNVIESLSVPIAYPPLSITKYHSTAFLAVHKFKHCELDLLYPLQLGVVSLEAQNDVGKRVGRGGADFFSESEWHVESIDAVAERSVRSGSIASGMSPPPLPRRSETQERMSFGLSLGEKDKVPVNSVSHPAVTPLFLDTKSSTFAVKPDVEAKPAPLTKPTQGLTTSEAFPSGGVDPASVPLPPSPIDHEMVFDHDEHDHDHDHEDEHIKGKTQNHPCKIMAPISPATPVRESTSTTTTNAEPSTAVVYPTASVIPIATATAAASEEVPRRAAKRAVPVLPGSPKAAETGEKASDGKASRVSGEQSRASERPKGEVQPATEAEIKPGVVDHVKDDSIIKEAKPKPSSSETAASSPSEKHSLGNNGHNNAVENGVSPDSKPVDNGTCISERTWEERTWKTLVKLREDMFWARIGGVR